MKSAKKILLINQQKTVQKKILNKSRKTKPKKVCKLGSDCLYNHSTDQVAIKDCETKYEVELKEKKNLLKNILV